MQPGFDRETQKRVPGGVEVDLVERSARAVEPVKDGNVAVGLEARPDRFGGAEPRAEVCELCFRPRRVLAGERLAEHGVAREQVHVFERRRLVRDLEH
jgi:hypothetical protein